MAKCKKIRYMNKTQFNALSSLSGEEIYAVKGGYIPDYTAGTKITATGAYTAASDGVLIATTASTTLSTSGEELMIIINDILFNLTPGTSNEDVTHISQSYLPISKGTVYTVTYFKNVNLYFFPFE